MIRRWSINGRFLTQPLSGVQRYAREIVRELDRLIGEGHALARGLELALLVPPGAGETPRLASIPVRRAGSGEGHLWEQAVLPRHVEGGLLSLCNTGPVSVSRQILCIHDTNTRAVPQSYSLGFRAFYRVLHPVLGRRAARVATVTRYSASQIARYGIAPRDRIDVMPNGHEHALRWLPAHSAATRPLADGRTVLAIGSPAPHKNMDVLLGIADDLAEAGLRLAIAGLRDSRVFRTPPAGHDSPGVVWLGRLSDEEIAALLRDALCLAFPSFAEGFGIPALEAMAWDCPVVASNRTSLPEVCGDAALYAAPDDPRAWRDQIVRLARDSGLRARLAGAGKAQAKRFSWRTSATLFLEAMAAVDSAGGDPQTAPHTERNLASPS